MKELIKLSEIVESDYQFTEKFIMWMSRLNNLLIEKTVIDILIIDKDFPEMVVPYKDWYYDAMSPLGAYLSIIEMIGGKYEKEK